MTNTWGAWGAPGLSVDSDDLGWGGEAIRGARGCGDGSPPLELLERDIMRARIIMTIHKSI